eukprot:scaffold112471_cov31-Tisochrysis_lutea.AAC.2
MRGAMETSMPYDRSRTRTSVDGLSSRKDSVRTMSKGRFGHAARRASTACRRAMACSKYSSSSGSAG